jgi:hypothetical protein
VNVAVMSHITKIAAIENTTAIWEYDPSLPGNRVLGGSLDVIASIHTIAIKVCIMLDFYLLDLLITSFLDSSFGTMDRIFREPPNQVQDPLPQQCAMGISSLNA